MMIKRQNVTGGLGRLFSFILRVLRAFKRNQGLLLSGAVAYNTLLSIVPMSTPALIVLSHFIEEEKLLEKSQKNDTNNQAVGFSFCS